MRRVITGVDADGKSAVLYDGPPQSIHHVTNTKVGQLQMHHAAAFPTEVPEGHCVAVDIWETSGLPRMTDADPMGEPRPFAIEPDGQGLRVRYQQWGANVDSSAMHATDTLDVNIIIEGEVLLLLEEGRTVTLRKGDAVVLPGNEHGWRAGPQGVTMINIMQKLG
ncbi:hypothetical protein [Rhizorhabdus dicambivorans]|uniref:Cupin domain-containing protein n=1 Tax=Rhizorhabdus dicambivorans TaxID=1850238 RepID=A0A2A4FZ14_9SPHN|nr:hypothetical protein [Rhizorhabdus dicambivorans]ATE65866.1 hypothetical protein CMV14_16860 [Rhizorhabdus dicambivorans]PCE42980.1 hypothetical protein COO09_06645 [Rhizorhabdus dicambivorans]